MWFWSNPDGNRFFCQYGGIISSISNHFFPNNKSVILIRLLFCLITKCYSDPKRCQKYTRPLDFFQKATIIWRIFPLFCPIISVILIFDFDPNRCNKSSGESRFFFPILAHNIENFPRFFGWWSTVYLIPKGATNAQDRSRSSSVILKVDFFSKCAYNI